MDQLEHFKKIFMDSFHYPDLQTEKFMNLWKALEPVNDLLAGPFYAIYSTGNCDYVFKETEKFPGISDVDDFLDYCVHWTEIYFEAVKKESADTDGERKDKEVLLFQTDLKMELSQLAYELQKERTQSSG